MEEPGVARHIMSLIGIGVAILMFSGGCYGLYLSLPVASSQSKEALRAIAELEEVHSRQIAELMAPSAEFQTRVIPSSARVFAREMALWRMVAGAYVLTAVLLGLGSVLLHRGSRGAFPVVCSAAIASLASSVGQWLWDGTILYPQWACLIFETCGISGHEFPALGQFVFISCLAMGVLYPIVLVALLWRSRPAVLVQRVP
jgi:hypothetical protein